METIISNFKNYTINTDGTIRNKNGKVIKCKHTKCGYLQATLYKDSKKFTVYPHRLVAEHFIPNPNNLPQVNHKDGNKDNCNDWNLEWSTVSDNIKHAYANGLHKPNINHNKHVIQISINTNEIINTFISVRDAERITDIDRSHIRKCCNGKANTAGGYIWKWEKGAMEDGANGYAIIDKLRSGIVGTNRE